MVENTCAERAGVSAEEKEDTPRPTCAENNVKQATEVNMDKIKDVRNYAKHQQIT